jgi:ubiquinone/menaquinone biosynthesis C-methylase UbiE
MSNSTDLHLKSINNPDWDYTEQAEYYQYRPTYAASAIDLLLEKVGARGDEYLIADVGAGTGNLTKMLLERGMDVLAIEPNAAMRTIGIQITKDQSVEWRIGTGEDTTLTNASVDLFAMGSSFNTTDRPATLREAARVLKSNGWFACMWNHRDLTEDPTQTTVETIIKSFFPSYSHGVRREDQSDILDATPDFTALDYIEVSQVVDQPMEDYIKAWRSVKNKFWDLKTKEGELVFQQIMEKIRLELPEILNLNYTTRIWLVRKKQ